MKPWCALTTPSPTLNDGAPLGDEGRRRPVDFPPFLPVTAPRGVLGAPPSPPPPPSADLEPGRRIGKYRLIYPLGEGGMSVVYLARDEVLERDVAVKVLHRHLARDPEARQRFIREARAVARLSHRNIPEVYDFSDENADAGTPSFIVSEFIDGAPLSRLLRDKTPLVPELCALIALAIARALAHAHAHQIIHRDVKPENVLIAHSGIVKLADFGIAQVRGLESMTMTGTLIGSPAFMAPEQITGDKPIAPTTE